VASGDPTETADSEDEALSAFVTAYQEALAAGQPPPSPEHLSPKCLARWEKLRGALLLLARAGRTSGSETARRALEDITPFHVPTDFSPEEHPHQFGRYQVIRELGRGGMGVVYLARDPDLQRLVAIKTLTLMGPEGDKHLVRFDAEARLHARQRHPNIVELYETGRDQGHPYLVMEYVEGKSLSQHLDGRPMEARRAAALVAQIAGAVEHAHRAGIVHRDLKPSNVLLDAAGTPRITDFGLATSLGGSFDLTRTGDLVGTPVYMAPEMATASGVRAGPAVDIYGLGAILYEVLTGRAPFVGMDVFLILSQVQHADPVAPRQLQAQVPRDLETICLKCLEKMPSRRYRSAAELADDLQRFLDGVPILARPAGLLERGAKFARRRPALAAAWAVSLAALVTIVIVVLVFNVQLADQRDLAARGEERARQAQARAESLLVERNVTLGLSAEKASNLPEAALWFAVGARQAPADSPSEQANRTRWQTYTAASPVPWRAVRVPDTESLEWLGLHPDGHWLITAVTGQWLLWDLDREAQVPWPGEARTVTAAAWSADGRFLATGSREGTVHLFHFPDWRIAAKAVSKGPVEYATFDPMTSRLVTVDGEHRLQIRTLDESLQVEREQEHPARIAAIAFSPTGRRLSTFSDGARAFDINSDGKGLRLLLGPVPQYHSREAYPSDEGPGFLSEDELVTCDNEAIRVWDLATQKIKKQFPSGAYHSAGTGVSARGGYVLVWRHLQEPELWQPADDRAAVDRTVRSPPAESVAIRPDGERFLLGFKNGVQLWTRDRSPASGVLWHHSLAHPLGWSADGRSFATAGQQGGIVRLWRAGEDRPISARLPLPFDQRVPIVFTLAPDGATVLTASQKDDETEFQLTSLADGKPVVPAVRVPGQPTGADFSPDGRTVYAVTRLKGRGWLHAWERGSGKPVFPAVELPFEPYDVACRPDGGALALAGGDNSEVELRTTTGTLIRHEQSGRAYAQAIFVCDRIRFAPDGKTFVTCGRSDRVWEWDGHTGAPRREFVLRKDTRCVDARYSPDGRYLATASTNGRSAVVWDLRDGSAAATIPHPDFVFSARFDPSGDRLVTACRDGKSRVWDWRAGRLSLPLLSQREEVTDAAFSPDGRWIASAEAGGRVRVWDARQGVPLAPGWLVQPPDEPFRYFANRVEFSNDGRYLLVGVRKRHLLVFDLHLLAAAPAALAPDDLLLLAEINAGAALLPGGNIEPLTAEHWFERWQRFRRRHPQFHALPEVKRSDAGTGGRP
jgi:WD40 repeat protein/predicted Ser/Thr protein kinase